MTGFTAESLITNIDNRTCNPKWPPLIAIDTETTDYNSCLKTNLLLLDSTGHLFILGIELDQISFVHKLLHVESHERYPYGDGFHTHWQDVIWHVGNSANYLENPQCPGPYPSTDYVTRFGSTVHKGGNEIDCNLSGKYITMVSDMTGADWSSSTGEAHLCSLGIFGTPYVRDEPLPTIIEVT